MKKRIISTILTASMLFTTACGNISFGEGEDGIPENPIEETILEEPAEAQAGETTDGDYDPYLDPVFLAENVIDYEVPAVTETTESEPELLVDEEKEACESLIAEAEESEEGYAVAIYSDKGQFAVDNKEEDNGIYRFKEGEEVSFSVTPDEGYMFSYVTITDKDGNSLYDSLQKELDEYNGELTDEDGNITSSIAYLQCLLDSEKENVDHFSFTMPASDCVIKVQFVATMQTLMEEVRRAYESMLGITIPEGLSGDELSEYVRPYIKAREDAIDIITNTESDDIVIESNEITEDTSEDLSNKTGALFDKIKDMSAGLLSVLGIIPVKSYAEVCNIGNDTNPVIPSWVWPSSINVNVGSNISYSNYSTHRYSATINTRNVNLYCVDPSRGTPSNDQGYKLVGSSTQSGWYDYAARILYYTNDNHGRTAEADSGYGGQKTYNGFVANTLGGNEDSSYALTHALLALKGNSDPYWEASDHGINNDQNYKTLIEAVYDIYCSRANRTSNDDIAWYTALLALYEPVSGNNQRMAAMVYYMTPPSGVTIYFYKTTGNVEVTNEDMASGNIPAKFFTNYSTNVTRGEVKRKDYETYQDTTSCGHWLLDTRSQVGPESLGAITFLDGHIVESQGSYDDTVTSAERFINIQENEDYIEGLYGESSDYSCVGAVYQIYHDKECTNPVGESFPATKRMISALHDITDTAGEGINANTWDDFSKDWIFKVGNNSLAVTSVTWDSNLVNTYKGKVFYIKETTASKGFELDKTIYSFVCPTDGRSPKIEVVNPDSHREKIIEEKRMTGFEPLMQTTHNNNGTSSDFGNVSFEPVSAYIRVRKESTSDAYITMGYSLSGAVFGVYSNAACTDKITELTTGEDGYTPTYNIGGEYIGETVYVKELTAPTGFRLNSTVQSQEITGSAADESDPVTFTVADEPITTAYIQVCKTSTNNKHNYVNYSLIGARFGIYSDSNCSDLITTLTTTYEEDNVGYTPVYNIGGEYIGETVYVKEIEAPSGFDVNDSVVSHEIAATAINDTAPVVFTISDPPIIHAYIQARKDSTDDRYSSAGYTLAGAVFGVYSDSACSNQIATFDETNSSGLTNVIDLAAISLDYVDCDVWVKEITAPSGFNINTAPVMIHTTPESNTVADLVAISDTPILRAYIQARKESTDNRYLDAGYTLAGAVFGVYSNSACTNLITTLTTGSDGTSPVVNLGGEYYLRNVWVKELTAPAHFELSTEVKQVYINAAANYEVSPVQFTMANRPIFYAYVQIEKLSQDPRYTYAPAYNGSGYSLANAVFGIYSDAACTNLIRTLTTVDMGNNTGKTPVTDIGGWDYFMRTVYVKELTAPVNYNLSAEVKPLTIGSAANVVTFPATTNISNMPIFHCWIDITKESMYPDWSATQGYTLAGAVYGLYSNSTCTAPVLVSGNPVIMTTNSAGYAKSIDLGNAWVERTIYVKELSVPRAGEFKRDTNVYSAMTIINGTVSAKRSGQNSKEDVERFFSFIKVCDPACAANMAGNDMYSLAGAEYVLHTDSGITDGAYPSYGNIIVGYDGQTEIEMPVNTGHPFITNANGYLTYTFNYTGASTNITNYYSNVVKSGNTYTITFNGNTIGKMIRIKKGSYWLEETKNSPGFRIPGSVPGDTSDWTDKNTYNSIIASDITTSLTCEEPPLFDPIAVQINKVDAETLRNDAVTGNARLGGAVFQIDYYDGIYNHNNLPTSATRTWYYQTGDGLSLLSINGFFEYGDPNYEADGYPQDEYYTEGLTGAVQLPLGTITIKEIVPPEGFLLVDDPAFNGSVDVDGQLNDINVETLSLTMYNLEQNPTDSTKTLMYGYDTTTHRVLLSEDANGEVITQNITYKNFDGPKRGDFQFIKVETTNGDPIANTAFVIEKAYLNEDGTPDLTKHGEKHIIVTDDNGFATTASGTTLTVDGVSKRMSVRDNTNGNDNATPEQIKNNELRPTGIWFYGQDDYSELLADPDYPDRAMLEDRGALPYDNYYLYEFRTVNNEGKQLIERGDKIFTIYQNDRVMIEYPYDSEYPSLTSKSKDATTETEYTSLSDNCEIVDVIRYQKLKYNTTYTVKNVLVARATFTTDAGVTYQVGDVIHDDNGDPITATATFTTGAPEGHFTAEASGEVTITATFPGETLGGLSAVWFTYLTKGTDTTIAFDANGYVDFEASNIHYFENVSGGKIYVTHENAYDTDEYVTIASLQTDAYDYETNINIIRQDDSIITVVDSVDITNLAEGEYKVVSRIVKKDGTPAQDKDGNNIEVTTRDLFPTTGSLSFNVTFPDINADDYRGEELVILQTIYQNGKIIRSTINLDYENIRETLYFPAIRTTLTDDVGRTSVPRLGTVTLVDKVYYTALKPGETYTAKGTLHYIDEDGNTVTVKDEAGNDIVSEQPFIATTANGFAEVTFIFNTRLIEQADSVVAFEELYHGDIKLCTHADIEDEDQTVVFPKIKTTVSRAECGFVSPYEEAVTLNDRVDYTSLTAGDDYLLIGKLANKTSGLILTYTDGTPVTTYKRFTPEAANGSVTVTFEDINISDIPNIFEDKADIVVYEYLYSDFDIENIDIDRTEDGIDIYNDGINDVLVWTTHADKNDADQTIRTEVPEIGTTLMGIQNEKLVPSLGEITLTDTVRYENLIPGKTYTLTGTLHYKDENETEQTLLDEDDDPITITKTFVPDEPSGSEDIVFTFDSSLLAVTEKIVAFENLSYDDIDICVHADINDEDQTVTRPTIHTSLAGKNGNKISPRDKEAIIVDTVSYTSLIPGLEYVVKGTLHYKDEDGNEQTVKDAKGNPVTGESKFTPTQANGTVKVTFKFDTEILKDVYALTAFEDLYYKNVKYNTHSDIDDEEQTVSVPEIKTTLTDDKDKKETLKLGTITLVDTVEYKALVPGKTYTMTGTLHYMTDKGEKTLLDKNGKEITQRVQFTPTQADGSVNVIFTFEADIIKDTDHVVAFEDLHDGDIKLCTHADIKDEGQTVTFPEIGTTVSRPECEFVSPYEDDVTLNDVVKYNNLKPGNDYILVGKLANKETGEVLTHKDGAQVVTYQRFRPTKEDDSITVSFKDVDFNLIPDIYEQNADIVVYEYLYYAFDVENATIDRVEGGADVYNDGTEDIYVLAIHADKADEGQTIRTELPEIRTTLMGSQNEKQIPSLGEITLTDTVHYENLIPGKTYTLTGTLHYNDEKGIERILLDEEGMPITVTKTFIPEEINGSEDIVFTFDSALLSVTEKIVAFESLSYKGMEISLHADIEDEDQTVVRPTIHTSLAGKNGNKISPRDEEAVIIDTVTYTSLIPGLKYLIEGTLHYKDEEGNVKTVKDKDGNPVTGRKEFIPEEANGTEKIVFKFNSELLDGVYALTAFENLFYKELRYNTHSDIDDEEQTVSLPEIKTTLTDDKKEKETLKLDIITLVDTVEYTALVPGKTYTMTGTLHYMTDEGEKALLDKNGDEIVSSVPFTPTQADGTVDITFKFEAELLDNIDHVVAFEDLHDGDIKLCTHADIKDKGQTVKFPSISTVLARKDNEKYLTHYEDDVTLIDTVSYSNLEEGTEYVLIGSLVNKDTGETIQIDGEDIISVTRFTAGEADAEVIFENLKLSELFKEDVFDLVAFEYLYIDYDEEEEEGIHLIAKHTSLEDEDQTIETPHVEITTLATFENEGKIRDTKTDTTVTDTLSYKGLIPGYTYTVKGYMVIDTGTEGHEYGLNKDAKTYTDVNGRIGRIVAETEEEIELIPEEQDGEIPVTFKVHPAGLEEKTLVVFEEVYYKDKLVTTHADIKDEGQSVKFTKKENGYITLKKGTAEDHSSNYRTEDNGEPGFSILFESLKNNSGNGDYFIILGITLLALSLFGFIFLVLLYRKKMFNKPTLIVISIALVFSLFIGGTGGYGLYRIKNAITPKTSALTTAAEEDIEEEEKTASEDTSQMSLTDLILGDIPEVVITEEEKEAEKLIVDYNYITDDYKESYEIPVYIEKDDVYYKFTGESKYRDEMEIKTVIQSVESDIRKDDETPGVYHYTSPVTDKTYELELYDDKRSELTVIPITVYAQYTKALEEGEETFPETREITYYDDVLEKDVTVTGTKVNEVRSNALLYGKVEATFAAESYDTDTFTLQNYGDIYTSITFTDPMFNNYKDIIPKALNLDTNRYAIGDGVWDGEAYWEDGLLKKKALYDYTCTATRKTAYYEAEGEAYGYHSKAYYYIPEEIIKEESSDIDDEDLSVLYKKVVSAEYEECDRLEALEYIKKHEKVDKLVDETDKESVSDKNS